MIVGAGGAEPAAEVRAPRRSIPWRALLAASLLAGAVGYFVWVIPVSQGQTDFRPLWYSARALIAGGDPYAAVGPEGALYRFAWPQLYPLPAILIVAPLAPLAQRVAFLLFVMASTALLAWAVARDHFRLVPLFASMSFLHAAMLGQWSPLLVAATLVPPLGFLFAAKPTIGLALFVYRPSRAAFIGCVVIGLVSLLVRPTWPVEWIERITSHSGNMLMPVTRWAGPLVLLAALRWRRPEARLLLLLAFIPQTLAWYEMLPLFLVAATIGESLLLAALSWVSLIAYTQLVDPAAPFVEKHALMSQILVALMYVPATLLVLRRKNEGRGRWEAGSEAAPGG